MRFLSENYPYILYSIPYLVAAYVLIRAKIKAVREARELEAQEAEQAEEAARVANVDKRLPERRISSFLERIKSRRAA